MAFELHFVSGQRFKVDGAIRFFPGVDAEVSCRLKKIVMTHRPNVILMFVVFTLCRREDEFIKINGVETFPVGTPDTFRKRPPAPRGLPDLIGVLMNEPIGFDFACEPLLETENDRQVEFSGIGYMLDPEDLLPEKLFGALQSPVGRTIIDKTDLDALRKEMLQTSFEIKHFVSNGDQCHDFH